MFEKRLMRRLAPVAVACFGALVVPSAGEHKRRAGNACRQEADTPGIMWMPTDGVDFFGIWAAWRRKLNDDLGVATELERALVAHALKETYDTDPPPVEEIRIVLFQPGDMPSVSRRQSPNPDHNLMVTMVRVGTPNLTRPLATITYIGTTNKDALTIQEHFLRSEAPPIWREIRGP